MKRHKTQKGAAMVEIALSLLIMLLLTIGLFEMAAGCGPIPRFRTRLDKVRVSPW